MRLGVVKKKSAKLFVINFDSVMVDTVEIRLSQTTRKSSMEYAVMQAQLTLCRDKGKDDSVPDLICIQTVHSLRMAKGIFWWKFLNFSFGVGAIFFKTGEYSLSEGPSWHIPRHVLTLFFFGGFIIVFTGWKTSFLDFNPPCMSRQLIPDEFFKSPSGIHKSYFKIKRRTCLIVTVRYPQV